MKPNFIIRRKEFRIILYVLTSILLSNICNAQNNEWAYGIGNAVDDYGQVIKKDIVGNIYVAGYFQGTVSFGSVTMTSNGLNDIFISKYSSSGNVIWAKKIGGTSSENILSITFDSLCNFYISGSFGLTVDFNPGAGTNNLTSSGSLDICFAKYDSSGNFIWAKKIGGTVTDESNSICYQGGNIYITGYFSGTNVDFNPGTGTYNLSSLGINDAFFAKYDTSGNFVFAKLIGGIYSDIGRSVDVDIKGNIYLTGQFASPNVDFDEAGSAPNLSASSADVYIAKYNNSGNYIWAKQINGSAAEIGYDITVSGKNLYLTGSLGSKNTDFDLSAGGTALLSTNGSAGSYDIFIAKYDTAFNYKWAKNFGGNVNINDEGQQIACDALGNVYATGYYSGTNVNFNPGGSALLTTKGGQEIFVAKYDSTGNYVWAKSIGGTGDDNGLGLLVDNDRNVYLTGGFTGTNTNFGYGTDSVRLTSNGDKDIFIAKYTDQATKVYFKEVTTSSFKIKCNKGYGTKRVIFVSTNIAGSPLPADKHTYSASTVFGSGEQIGSTGWYCVYNGDKDSVVVTGLTEGSTYRAMVCEYTGIAGKEVYVSYKAIGNPSAGQFIDYTTPTLQTTNIIVTDSTDCSATLSWTNGNGTSRAIFIHTDGYITPSPANNTPYSANTIFKSGSALGGGWYCVYNGSGNSVTVTGLNPNSIYIAQAFEYRGNSGKEKYLNSSASGNPASIYTEYTKPTTQASNLVFSNINENSLKLDWTNGDGANRIVFATAASIGSTIPDNHTTYSASTAFGSGTQIGSTGWFCVYKGTGSSVTVTGLTQVTDYRFQIFEYSGISGSENYLTITANKNPAGITSDYTAPTLQASNVTQSGISDTSSTISWTNGNGTGRVVFMAKDAGLFILLNDSTYPANSNYTLAANGYSGWVCVYNGNGSSFSVTGLTPNTQYHLRVCEYLGEPYRETFNTSGTSISFTTKNKTIINFTETIDKVYFDPDFAPGATTNSGNTIIYSSSDNSIATIMNNKIHLAKSGSCKIYATDNGNNTYTFAKDSAILTISKAPLAISLKGSPIEKFYGDPDPVYEFVASTLSSNDTITSVSHNSSAQTGDTGTFDINLSNATFKIADNISNYTVTYNKGKIKVKPAPLTITAEEKTRTYGELNPVFTWKVAGLKKTDSIKQVTITCEALPRSELGTYTIVPSNPVFETGKASNYTISFVNSNLTVIKSPIEICLVTIDMETGYSMVVWERNNSAGLKGYNVYRQNTEVGSYSKIGNIPISATGIFIDSTSAIERHAELYKITTIDSRSIESRLDQCNYHKSLFLQYAGTVGGVNLNWQPYEVENSGINFKSYVIYKGTDSTRLTVVDTVASNIYNYTDNDPNALIYKTYYRIAGLKYTACYPEGHRKAGAGPFSESISNLEDNRLRASQNIQKLVKNTFDLVVNPHPVRDICAIRYNLPAQSNVSACIINMLGETVANINVGIQQEGNAQFYLDTKKYKISVGMYFLKVNAGKYEATIKISVVK